MFKPSSRAAFTLIELLVVISIIVLLLAILLPSLQGARKTARQMQCASNERSTMLALMMYADANKNLYPEISQNAPDGSPYVQTWAYWLPALTDGTYLPLSGPLIKHIHSNGGYPGFSSGAFCPELTDLAAGCYNRRSDPVYGLSYWASNFGLNVVAWTYGGGPNGYRGPLNRDRVKKPSNMLFLGETYNRDYVDSDISGNGACMFPHGKQEIFNAGYFDGHVSTRKIDDPVFTSNGYEFWGRGHF